MYRKAGKHSLNNIFNYSVPLVKCLVDWQVCRWLEKAYLMLNLSFSQTKLQQTAHLTTPMWAGRQFPCS